MELFLYKVEEVFNITGSGIILWKGMQVSKIIPTGSKIKLLKPDNTIIETTVKGISFQHGDILIGTEFTKEDIPIGTEVWLIES